MPVYPRTLVVDPGFKLPYGAHLYETPGGYLLIYYPGPNTGETRLELLHRVVYSQLADSIPPGMVIHHADGDKKNNFMGNLVPMDPAEHTRLHQQARNSTPKSQSRRRKPRRSKKHRAEAPQPN